jgi:hypothetical protein
VPQARSAKIDVGSAWGCPLMRMTTAMEATYYSGTSALSHFSTSLKHNEGDKCSMPYSNPSIFRWQVAHLL